MLLLHDAIPSVSTERGTTDVVSFSWVDHYHLWGSSCWTKFSLMSPGSPPNDKAGITKLYSDLFKVSHSTKASHRPILRN